MDSSVIFLVVLGLWAAYLVPHWLRRREDLSASRSVDRFSAAMRVLSRRPGRSDRPDRPRTSAYVLAPARATATLPAAAPAHVEPDTEPDTGPGSEPDTGPGSGPHLGPVPPGRRRTRPHRVLARVLGAVLVLSLLSVPALGVLSVLGLAPGWAAAPAAGLAALLVVALRASARRRGRAARAVVPAEAVRVVGRPEAGWHDQVVDEVVQPREQLFDVQAHAAREEQERIRRLAEEALRAADVPYREPEPGEWTPVAVPLPAYLLKPHARPAWQPATAPAARTVDVDEDDIPTYAPPTRRVAGA